MTPLRSCPGCSRHVRVSEQACPFCGRELGDAFRSVPRPRALAGQSPTGRLSRAALFALGAGGLTTSSACSSSPARSAPSESEAGSDAEMEDAGSVIPMIPFYGCFPCPGLDVDAEEYSPSQCKPGYYEGTFTGTYSSPITVVGIGIPMAGNVQLTLEQQGSSNQMCSIDVQGEGVATEHCNDVFTVSGGTITGVANGITDAGASGYPFYCTMTGTLDCARKVLDNGWLECTYCAVGVIPDDGGAASGDPLAVCNGAGGNFAGVLQANYDTSTFSFTDGAWNGAEDLCTGIGGTSTASCNDGGSPGPEGGPATNYLRPADGGYGVAPNYGGAGNWNASCLDCEHD